MKEALLGDLLPGPVTLVFERAETLNADLNPFTTVCPLPKLDTKENKIAVTTLSKGSLSLSLFQGVLVPRTDKPLSIKLEYKA